MTLRGSEQGLVSRDVVGREDGYMIVREVWDTSVPGCPVIVVNFCPFRTRNDAVVERTIRVAPA
jgi:hypothetical protein